MRIAKCLIIVLMMATVTWAEQKLTNTREASCILKITVDPDILPLNPQTVDHLLGSSAVLGKAAQEVLGVAPEVAVGFRDNIVIEWLAQSFGQGPMPTEPAQRGRRRSRSTGQPRDEGYEEMMEQLREIYGDRLIDPQSSQEPGAEKQPDSTNGRGMMMGSMGGGGYGGGMGGYGSRPADGAMGMGMMGGGTGGMMGGGAMGGYGMGGMYGMPLQARPGVGDPQNAVVRLSVLMPETVSPVAEEFLAALVENLKQTLRSSYEAHVKELEALAEFAESRREEAELNLNAAMGLNSLERMKVEQQLDTIVDLSMLAAEMPFSEAVKYLKNAVEPPLPIVVLWKELLDSCDIEPTTPIDMDGPENVRLGTALKMLVAAVGGSHADISYQIDDDVIVIREEETQTPLPASVRSYDETDARELSHQRRNLLRDVQRLEMGLAVDGARRQVIEEQIAELQHQTKRKLAEDVVTQELQKIIDGYAKEIPLYTPGSPDVMALQEKLARVRIELVQRREALSKSVGGGRFSQLSEELSRMAIDAAETRTQIEIMRRQLAEAEDQLAQASAFDPQAARIRTAREALDVAETQVTRLRTRVANLQPPMVAAIGANRI